MVGGASGGASSVRPKSFRGSSTRRRSGRASRSCPTGGTVEGYPEDASGRKVSGSSLYNGTIAMFERHGFARGRQIGKYRWVVHRLVA